uniref:Kinesin-like protein 2 n=2 Tax=Hirondellea gigas TaxID=1518452 RepID=A0A6A7FUT9_9CRUS
METPVRAISRVRPAEAGDTDGYPEDSSSTRGIGVVEVAPAASQVILGHDHFCDFDAVFGPDVSQKELYAASLEDLVTNFFEGYNVSVVGYGSSGSGKTHTITGPGFLWAMNEEEFGLLPRAVRQLYHHITEAGLSSPGYESHVSVSYLLLCAGAVYDLLTSQPVLLPLPILADHKGSVMVPGLSSVDCNSINEVLNCLEAGLVARHNHAVNASTHNTTGTAAADALNDTGVGVSNGTGNPNKHSSPVHTHASFTITLQQSRVDKEGKARILCSRLNFVDLAGLDQKSASLTSMTASSALNNNLSAVSVKNSASFLNNADNIVAPNPSLVGSSAYSNTDVLGSMTACSAVPDNATELPHEYLITKDNSNNNQLLASEQEEDAVYLKNANLDCNNPKVGEFLLRRDSTNVMGSDECIGEDGGGGDAEEDQLCGVESNIDNDDGVDETGVVMSPDHQCLASVIACLVDRNYTGPIPYTHSMLTQLLKESLGGNCLTLFVCCASPSRRHLPATLLTMKYGGLARYILNKPLLNDVTLLQQQLLSVEQPQQQGSSNTAPSVAASQDSTNNVASAANNNNYNTHNNNSSAVKPVDPEEIFRLQFSGWQLQQLVDGADSLLRSCLPFLPPALQAQAAAWLCRRNEAAHCLGPPMQPPPHHPHYWNQQHRDARGLHVIEEVSEPGDPRNSGRSTSSCGSNRVAAAERSLSSASSLGEEFYEQLAVFTNNFADHTTHLVKAVEDRLDTFSEHSSYGASSDDESSGQENMDADRLSSSEHNIDCDSMTDKSAFIIGMDDNSVTDVNINEKLLNFVNANDASKIDFGDTSFVRFGSVGEVKQRDGSNKSVGESENKADASKSSAETVGKSNEAARVVPTSQAQAAAAAAGRGGSHSAEDSDANMNSYDSEVEDSSSSGEEVEKRGESSSSMVRTRLSRRRMSLTGQQLSAVSEVAMHAHHANRRRQRELRETVKEKESQLRTLQRGAQEKEELMSQNQAKLQQLQQLTNDEAARLRDARHHAKSAKGNRMQELESSSRLQQHEAALAQYRDRSKAIQSFINIIEATKTPEQELQHLSSRLQELRCELAEVETVVRVDDQRKQRLQDLRNNRPRKQSGRLSAEEDELDDDLEDPLFSGHPLQEHIQQLMVTVSSHAERMSTSGVGSGRVLRESVAVRGEEHITIRRATNGKAGLSVHGLSQPHKRRLITSSSEQCSSSGEDSREQRVQQQLRGEIGNLREARDVLITCRQRLNRRIHKGGVQHGSGKRVWECERRLLELDEAVEAVDSTIEYKNELICGRAHELAATSALLMQVQYTDQSHHLQKLEWSYQQASLDMERRCAVQQTQYLQHLHKLLRHIDTQESASLQQPTIVQHTEVASTAVVRELEMSLYYYKDQCTQLKTLIKQQQGQGRNFQPMYQQLQQQQQQHTSSGGGTARQQKDRTNRQNGDRHSDIGLKLSTLGPGSTLMSPPSISHYRNGEPSYGAFPARHKKRFLLLGANQQQVAAGNTAPSGSNFNPDVRDVASGSVNAGAPAAGGDGNISVAAGGVNSSSNPFMRRSRLEPGRRRRPPSSSRYRMFGGSSATGGRHHRDGSAESIPMTHKPAPPPPATARTGC